MSWEGLAAFVLRHPRWVLTLALAGLVAPTLALGSMETSFDLIGELPETSDSVRGYKALEGSFGPGQVQPVVIVSRTRKTVWSDAAFQAIDQMTVELRKVPGVAEVRSITRPSGGRVSERQLEAIGLGDVSSLTEDIPRATEGLGRALDGLRQIRGGLEQILATIPGQGAGIQEALDGIAEMRGGLARIIPGLERIHEGLADVVSNLRELRHDAAVPALRNLRLAFEDLKQTTTAKTDPQYPDLVEHVSTAYIRVSGKCPDFTGTGAPQPPDCPVGAKIDPRYEGLPKALEQLAEGTASANDGVQRVHDGLVLIDGGLARLQAGLGQSEPQIDALEDGASRMVFGLDRIIPGLERLQRGLAAGQALLRQSGLAPDTTGEVPVTADLASAFPKLHDQLSFFVGENGHAVRTFVTLDRTPYGPPALATTREIRRVSRMTLRDSPLQDQRPLVTGSAPFFLDVSDVSQGDFWTIVLAVVIGVFVVLALLLRSLVAPTYLVGTVLLSFAATMGLTVIMFQWILGRDAIVWWLPIFLFVTLVALGADYNIFLTGRIREEASTKPTREAVARGLSVTGHVITSAGIILAGTFAVLLIAPIKGMAQMGFAATCGILIDTFVVRSLLVPAIAVLVGSASWWPSARARRP